MNPQNPTPPTPERSKTPLPPTPSESSIPASGGHALTDAQARLVVENSTLSLTPALFSQVAGIYYTTIADEALKAKDYDKVQEALDQLAAGHSKCFANWLLRYGLSESQVESLFKELFDRFVEASKLINTVHAGHVPRNPPTP